MSDLTHKKCVPCSSGVAAANSQEIMRLHQEVPEWEVVEGHHLSRAYGFSDFVQTLVFVNKVGEMAEEEGHHPNITFTYGQARIDIWTHQVDGLTESDFILAAKIDTIA